MNAWHDCTALQRDLLKAIADHDHYNRKATADALQIAVETRREGTLADTRVTDALTELGTDELITTTTSDTYALTDRGQDAIQQAAQSLAIVTGHDLVVTDGGTPIRSHTQAVSTLDTVLHAAEPAHNAELDSLAAVSTYLRSTDGFVIQTHAEPEIRTHALTVIAASEDEQGAPVGVVLDTLASEYGAKRAMTALLDLLIQRECYQPQPATFRRVNTDTGETGGDQ